MNKINLALVGATGMVGQTFLQVLIERKFYKNIKNLYLFASENSAGEKVDFNGKKIKIEALNESNIFSKKIDYAFFAVDENLSKKFAPIFTQCGVTVIDNSSAFRLKKNVPLIVPEVNFKPTQSKIISNPNCSTIQSVVPINILEKNFGVSEIFFTTFQAVSGSGVNGVEDLKRTARGEKNEFYPYKIFNNCLPQIGGFDANKFTSEELKMIKETQKILGKNKIKISATCVRVPVENCHSISVIVKLKKRVNLQKIFTLFESESSLKIVDDLNKNLYPICDMANGKDTIFLGRIRQDLYNKKILHFWCVADNIRKGASTNGVQILEKILKNN